MTDKHTKESHESHEHEHKEHHAEHKEQEHHEPVRHKHAQHKHPVSHAGHEHVHHKHAARKPKSKMKYVWGVVALIVLVAIVYGVIVLLGRMGGAREDTTPAAIVNGETITMSYLDEQYSRIPVEYQAFVTKSVLLNQTINEVLLLQQAKKISVSVTDAEVKQQIDDAMANAGLTEAQLDEKLAEQNLTRAFLEDLYRKQLTINKLLEEKVFVKLKVSQQEVVGYYDSRIRAAHILVEDEDAANDLVLQLQRASSDGLNEKFFELAEANSIDPSAKTNRGDLGEFSSGMMVPEFEQAAFALEEGEFTRDPVKTQFGYHIILRLPKDKALAEQSSEIEEFLLLQKKSSAVPLYVEKLRENAEIQVLYTGEAPVEE